MFIILNDDYYSGIATVNKYHITHVERVLGGIYPTPEGEPPCIGVIHVYTTYGSWYTLKFIHEDNLDQSFNKIIQCNSLET